MEIQKLEPEIVHRLPGAPTFAGRERELLELDNFWKGDAGVLSLVGVGGAGKTALCERFVAKLLETEEADGLFVWSFYDEPDSNAFLRAAHRYFSGSSRLEAHGPGWFHALKESLGSGSRYVLVLDGLERIQRPVTEARGVFGELEDPLLRGLLRRLVSGVGRAKVLITSRFPVSDLESSLGSGYAVLDVDQLDRESAFHLLEYRGVGSPVEVLERLLEQFGGHALTLDLLSGAIARFFNGDAAKVPPPQNEEQSDENPQARRLAHTLNLYIEHLDQSSLDLLTRLCVFRFGVAPETLTEIFLKSANPQISGALNGLPTERLEALLQELQEMHLVHRGGDLYTVHPAVRDHFYGLFRQPGTVHEAVSSHLMTLTGRPGVGPPSEKGALDLLEELVYHAIKAGKLDEAVHVYADRMGANEHLNVQLGEYARTHRILRAFPECPDPSGMYHCLRSFGRLSEALEWRPQNRYVQILSGELEKLSKDANERTSRVAWFLRGEAVTLPDRLPDFPLCTAWLLLCHDMVEEARLSAQAEIAASSFADDIMRNRIALAEAERRVGNPTAAKARIEEATPWVLNSASHEHLCLFHGVRARLALDENRVAAAWSAIEEALQIAIESEFDLLRVDHLATASQIKRTQGQYGEAMALAREARDLALEPRMNYLWGEIAGRFALALSLRDGGDPKAASEELGAILAVQRRSDDPSAAKTEKLLAEIAGVGN